MIAGPKRVLAMALLCMVAVTVLPSAFGQQEITRKVKTKVEPQYPELARRMNIIGVVKLQITVASNGTVKSAKVIGGHPVLADAALNAVKQWRYEPADQETTGLVEFHFDRNP